MKTVMCSVNDFKGDAHEYTLCSCSHRRSIPLKYGSKHLGSNDRMHLSLRNLDRHGVPRAWICSVCPWLGRQSPLNQSHAVPIRHHTVDQNDGFEMINRRSLCLSVWRGCACIQTKQVPTTQSEFMHHGSSYATATKRAENKSLSLGTQVFDAKLEEKQARPSTGSGRTAGVRASGNRNLLQFPYQHASSIGHGHCMQKY